MPKYTLIELPDKTSWIKHYEEISKKLQVDKELFTELWNLHPEKRSTVIMQGREISVPRWQESFGRGYYYSGKYHKANPIEHPYLKKLLKWVRKKSGENYNQILINWYQDGNHYIGAHSDDTTQLIKDSAIYSFSFGQPRDFVITSKNNRYGKYKNTLKLHNNSLVVMGGTMQENYKHAVPKRSVKKCPYKRINITFRLFKE